MHRLRRTLIKALAILAVPIVEEATLHIHRRRRIETREAGSDGINELSYWIFGPNLKPVASAAAASPRSGDVPQPHLPTPQSSAEVVQFDRRSAS
jgi:hypothetical protein